MSLTSLHHVLLQGGPFRHVWYRFPIERKIVISDRSVVHPSNGQSAGDASFFRVIESDRVLKLYRVIHFARTGKIDHVTSSLHPSIRSGTPWAS